MHKYNSLENDHQKQANINQLFDSILTGKTIKIGTENNIFIFFTYFIV